jgi:hypothetical protein
MRAAARAGAALAATAFDALAVPPSGAAPGEIALPKPVGAIPVPAEVFSDRPERLRTSQVPGRVDDTERVDVLVGPTGTPAAVTMTQRLVLSGTGQYVVWQRSSAQDAEALEDTPAPVLKREAVIWQGFVDGSELLAARLTLDPVVEAQLLPVAVELEWRGNGALAPGGDVPGPGEVVVRLRNRTARQYDLPTGVAASAKDLAGPLDTLLRAGTSRTPAVPPSAGRELPASVRAADTGAPRNVAVAAPLRVTGTIRLPGGRPVSQPSGAVTHLPDGLKVDGVLQGDVEFVVAASAAGTVALDLRLFPTVDPRELQPPNAPTWAEWARRGPSKEAVRAATDVLVRAAAEAARGTDFAPYLGHHGPGKVTTTFHVSMAPASLVPAVEAPLRPKPVPIALAGVGTLALLSGAFAVWRRL